MHVLKISIRNDLTLSREYTRIKSLRINANGRILFCTIIINCKLITNI